MKVRALGILVAFTCNFTLANEASDSTSAYDTSYKCEVDISSGLHKENGVVSHTRFAPTGEFFVTHTSDFPGDVLDAFLQVWDASEDQMALDYPTKRELVSYVLFDEEELSIGDGYRSEMGSYWFREASDNPT